MAQQALKTVQGNTAAVVNDAPVPELEDDWLLAETKAVALNPTDYKHMRFLAPPGCTLGCDWAGVVVKVGKDVTKFKAGDEVFGLCHGGHNTKPHAGCFARYIVSKECVVWRKPSYLSFEEAAALPVGLVTLGQVMYHIGKMPPPSGENLDKPPTKDVLIYGAGSATGTLAVQLARLSGYRPLTTSSPSQYPLLHSRGVSPTCTFTYHDPATAIPAIQTATAPLGLTYIIDCIGDPTTAAFCAPLLSPSTSTSPSPSQSTSQVGVGVRGGGGHYHSIRYPAPEDFKKLRPESDVVVTSALGYSLIGEPFQFANGWKFEADVAGLEFAREEWWGIVQGLLDGELLVPHPVEVRRGKGLEGVLEGVVEVEDGRAPRGKKLVYTLDW